MILHDCEKLLAGQAGRRDNDGERPVLVPEVHIQALVRRGLQVPVVLDMADGDVPGAGRRRTGRGLKCEVQRVSAAVSINLNLGAVADVEVRREDEEVAGEEFSRN